MTLVQAPAATLVGRWMMDPGVGTVATDSSANGNTATLTNGPLWLEDAQIAGGLAFDGSNDCPHDPVVARTSQPPDDDDLDARNRSKPQGHESSRSLTRIGLHAEGLVGWQAVPLR